MFSKSLLLFFLIFFLSCSVTALFILFSPNNKTTTNPISFSVPPKQEETVEKQISPSPSGNFTSKQRAYRRSSSCPSAPYFYPSDAPAGISNQREHWLNHLLLANVLGFKTIVLPTACPLGYVNINQHSISSRNEEILPPAPYEEISAPNHLCGPMQLLIDVERYTKVAEEMGFCVLTQENIDIRNDNVGNNNKKLKSRNQKPQYLAEVKNMQLRDWNTSTVSSEITESRRFVYTSNELFAVKHLQIDKIVTDFQREQDLELKERKANFATYGLAFSFRSPVLVIRPTSPLTTVLYARFYDKCEEFCACNEIIRRRAMRPNKMIRMIVDALMKILRREANPTDFEWKKMPLLLTERSKNNKIDALFRNAKVPVLKAMKTMNKRRNGINKSNNNSRIGASSSSSKISELITSPFLVVAHLRAFKCKYTLHRVKQLTEEIATKYRIFFRSTMNPQDDNKILPLRKMTVEALFPSSFNNPPMKSKRSSQKMDGDEEPPEVILERIKSQIPFFESSKPMIYVASELSVSDKSLDSLQRTFNLIQKEIIFPELKLFPFEVRSLIDYEIGLRSDLFLGYPGGSSFTQFLFLERRLMELSKITPKVENFGFDQGNYSKDIENEMTQDDEDEDNLYSPKNVKLWNRRQALREFSRRNSMLMTFSQFCTKQSTRTHWNGVPVFDDYETENQIREQCIWKNKWLRTRHEEK